MSLSCPGCVYICDMIGCVDIAKVVDKVTPRPSSCALDSVFLVRRFPGMGWAYKQQYIVSLS